MFLTIIFSINRAIFADNNIGRKFIVTLSILFIEKTLKFFIL